MEKIVFAVQTGYHPERIAPVLENIAETANHPELLEVVLQTHADDPASHHFDHPRLNIQTIAFGDDYSSSMKAAYIFNNTTGKIFAGMSDDFIIHTRGWDDALREIFGSYPDGIAIVGINDLMFKDSLFTIPFISRRHIQIIGVNMYIHPLYSYYRVDDHVHHTYDILRRLGHDRIVYREDIVFEHNHYTMVEGKRVYTPSLHPVSSNDGIYYYYLESQRKIDALKLAMAIDPSRAGKYAERLIKIDDKKTNYVRTL